MSDKPSSADNLRGIGAMLLSQAAFLLSDSVVKVAGAAMPASQIMAVRGVMATVLMGFLLLSTVEARKWWKVAHPVVVLRGVLEAMIAVFFLAALPHLPLNDVTVISQVTPLILTVMSAMLLGEAVGAPRWIALVVGFVGVVLVAQPGAQGVNAHVWEVLMVALLTALRELTTRVTDESVPTRVVAFTSTLAVCLLGFAGLDGKPWAPLTVNGVGLLAASAVLVSFGIITIVVAFRDVEVSVVSPFRYSAVLWSMLFAYLIWSERPNDLAVLGTALIVVSGVYAMALEAAALRRRTTTT